MKKVSILLACLIAYSLTGCAAVVVGAAVAGAAGTTAVVATDPRTSGAVIDDNTIQTKLKLKYASYRNANIYVNSYNGNVLLTGQIPDIKTKESAEFEAKATPGVKQIYDYLTIRLPQSLFSSSTDSYTTAQVRAKIFKIKAVDGNSVKVVTTDDVVYLEGIVTPEQAALVTNAAASTGGVKKVVTLFDYVTAK
jgi:osmotically-inducible protein OsmY